MRLSRRHVVWMEALRAIVVKGLGTLKIHGSLRMRRTRKHVALKKVLAKSGSHEVSCHIGRRVIPEEGC